MKGLVLLLFPLLACMRFCASHSSLTACIDCLFCCTPQVGWKHQEAVKDLEEVRKVRSHDYYIAKRKLKALKTKAEATVSEQA